MSVSHPRKAIRFRLPLLLLCSVNPLSPARLLNILALYGGAHGPSFDIEVCRPPPPSIGSIDVPTTWRRDFVVFRPTI